jgi:hypothetical protein
MPRKNLWNANLPRVELDQRVREARLRLERIERLLVPRAAVTNSWLRRVFYLFRLGIHGNASPGSQTTGPLSNQRPSRLPKIHQVVNAASRCVLLRYGVRTQFAFSAPLMQRRTSAPSASCEPGDSSARCPAIACGRR